MNMEPMNDRIFLTAATWNPWMITNYSSSEYYPVWSNFLDCCDLLTQPIAESGQCHAPAPCLHIQTCYYISVIIGIL